MPEVVFQVGIPSLQATFMVKTNQAPSGSYNPKVNQNLIVTGVPAPLSMCIFLATSRGKYTWKQTPGQRF